MQLGYGADDLSGTPLSNVKWSGGGSGAGGRAVIDNLQDLAAALAAADTAAAALLTFELIDGKVITLPRDAATRATEEVARVHSMSCTRSADLPLATAAVGGGAAGAASKRKQ